MKAKKLSKRIIASIVAMMLVIGCFVLPATIVGAANETTVRFHYLRDDGDYSTCDVYTWGDGDAKEFKFTDNGDARGAVADVVLSQSIQSLGFIIREVSGDWSTKDPDGDRKVDLSSVSSGIVDVYCVSGSELDDYEVSYENAVQGLKLKTASATSRTEISFVLTTEPAEADGEITTADFEVASISGTAVAIASVDLDGAKGTLALADGESLDYTKEYTISFRGTAMNLSMPDYFSSEEFESAYTYDGDDLGANYSADKTFFRVWAPTAEKMELNLYAEGNGGEATQVINMTADVKGTWVATVEGDLNGTYYTYNAYFDGKTNTDIVDPYARTVGVNGKRGMVIDLDSTDPDGWDSDERHTYENATDMVIYELHVRDFSTDPDSGIKNVGKYIAFAEEGTTTSEGIATGIDHLKELGITSVHILPSYDYGSVNEEKLDEPQFNWGYDPVNYNSPEGSYSTDPYHGEVRVNEYKQMVKALHDAGIGVIMDVVYNHTYNTNYCFNLLVPGYFYRPGQNTSGCGNDVASERSMVSKFISDSVKYWADEYHLDGFRFDLMGILDVDTMNNCRAAVDELDRNIFIYGEGWDMGSKPTKSVDMANWKNASKTPRIAYFSDKIRDAIRGNVFEAGEAGYVGGAYNMDDVKDGIANTGSWANSPIEVINYDSCHDNHTIWDRLANTNPDDSEEDRIKMNKMAAAIVFTSQGVPFMMSGEEFLRTKLNEDGSFEHNSYASPDSVNLLDYSRIAEYENVYNYYKGLIEMRKAFPQFRMTSADDVKANLSFTYADNTAIGYTLTGGENDTLVFFNPDNDKEIQLPEGKWSVIVNGEAAGTEVLDVVEGTITLPTLTTLVLLKDYNTGSDEPIVEPSKEESGKPADDGSGSGSGDGNGSGSDSENGKGNNDNNNDDSGNSNVPATGDTSTAVFFVFVACAAGLTAILTLKRKNRV